MKPVIVVMAAGLGSRYGSLKQMDSIGPNGESILEYSIYDAIEAGFERVVFIINQEMKVSFKDKLASKFKNKIDIHYVIQSLEDIPVHVPNQRVKPWGTAHAVYACRNEIMENFAVINADDFYGRDAFKQMYTFLSQHKKEFALITYPVKNTLSDYGSVSRGICQVTEGYLEDIEEKSKILKKDFIGYQEEDAFIKLSENTSVSMNFWGFTPRIFREIHKEIMCFVERDLKENPLTCELYLPKVIQKGLEKQDLKVKVIQTQSQWFGVTYKEDKALVRKKIDQLIEAGHYPKKLWEDL